MRQTLKTTVCLIWLLAVWLALALLAGCNRVAVAPGQSAASRDVAQEASSYPAELAEARSMGLPLSLEDLQQPLPANEANAADIYKRLGHMLRAYPLSSRELALEGLSTEPLPTPRALMNAERALKHRAGYLVMVHQAASTPSCVFEHNWDAPDPESISFPEMATIREASMLLAGQSVLLAQRGKPLAAVQNEALGFHMADQAASERLLVGFEVACDVDNITLTTLQKIIYISHGEPKIAQAVRLVIAQRWHNHSLTAALQNEAAFEQNIAVFTRRIGPSAIQDITGMSTATLNNDRGSPAWNTLMDANAAVLLKETIAAINVADLPYPRAKPKLLAIVADSMQPMPSRLLAAVLQPDLARFAQLRAQTQAHAEAVQVGASILAAKVAQNADAKSPEQVLKSLPVDPFSEKPLRYRPEGDGFVVYSVGPLGSFSGGSPKAEPPATEALFRYPVPAYDLPAKPALAVTA